MFIETSSCEIVSQRLTFGLSISLWHVFVSRGLHTITMDFAKGLLMKYGWQEGQGIGKNADGIVKPIKANLKFDNTGLDYDRAAEFTNHWWERAFNSAADNLNINTSTENVSLSVKDNEAVELTTNGFSVKKLKDKQYSGYFQKSNHTLDRLENSSESETETDDTSKFNQNKTQSNILTDEDILKACGGRTAHKGARHGLSLSGKLSRIEAQEKQFLAQNTLNSDTATNIFQSWVEVKKKRKNRDRKSNTETPSVDVDIPSDIPKCLTSSPDSDKLVGLIDENDYQIKCSSKKKKRQQRHRDEELAKSLSQLSANDTATNSRPSQFESVQNSSKAIKKEKRMKKKHRKRLAAMETDLMTTDEELNRLKPKSKKSKRNGCQLLNNSSDASSSDCDEDEMPEDPLVQQIADVMKRYPSKKFKVVAEELTPFQKKHLQKSGLRIELKSKKRDKKKRIKERVQLEKISKKIEKSMVFS